MIDKILKVLTIIWFFIVMTPSAVLMYKLTIYLYETAFREWWITLLWALITPVSITIISINRLNKKKEEK